MTEAEIEALESRLAAGDDDDSLERKLVALHVLMAELIDQTHPTATNLAAHGHA